MEEAESFGEQLQRYRKAADLSRLELAQRAGISRNSILNLERGATRGAHQYTVERLVLQRDIMGGGARLQAGAAVVCGGSGRPWLCGAADRPARPGQRPP